MSIQHDKNLLLSVAVDTTHGDVDVVVTVNDGHAGDVGRQYLLQVASTTVAYHLLSDKRCWHRHLVQVLSLIRGGGDGRGVKAVDLHHHINESLGVAYGWGVIAILVEQQLYITFRSLRFVEAEAAQGQQSVPTLFQTSMEGVDILCK